MTKYHSLFLQLLDGMIMIHHRFYLSLYTLLLFLLLCFIMSTLVNIDQDLLKLVLVNITVATKQVSIEENRITLKLL